MTADTAARQDKLCVLKLMDRRSSTCPLTIVRTNDEYRLLEQIKMAVASVPTITGLFLWDAEGMIKDLVNVSRTDHPEQCPPLEAIRWFARTPSSNSYAVEKDERSSCLRSNLLLEMDALSMGGAPPGSIMVVFDSIRSLNMVEDRGHSNVITTRAIKNLSLGLSAESKSVFLVNHLDEIPPEFRGFCPVVTHEGPTRRWMLGEVRRVCSTVVVNSKDESAKIPKIKLDEPGESMVVDELRGLSSVEIKEALSLASRSNANKISTGLLPPDKRGFDLEAIREYKSAVLKRSSAMRIVHPVEGGFSVVGGLGRLKAEVLESAEMVRMGAGVDGISPPKGVLMVGPGGTGKSLIAKAIGSIMNRQIVCLDVSACKGGLVGQSESQFRNALEVADRMSPVVLFLDEFEKVWGGAGQALDSGVSSGMLQTWLTWMQDWKDPGVYVVAACNDIRNIPGPVVRSGRFDSIVYVPLPGFATRKEILSIHLRKRGWEDAVTEEMLDAVASITHGFSGAELERVVELAIRRKIMRDGVGRSNPVTMEDLVESAANVVPTAQTHSEEILSLQEWADRSGVLVASDEPMDFTISKGRPAPVRGSGGGAKAPGRAQIETAAPGEEENGELY